MIDVLLLSSFQILLILLCAVGLSEFFGKKSIKMPITVCIMLIFSLIHFLPVALFLFIGLPLTELISLSLILGSISGLFFIKKEKLKVIIKEITNSRWTCISFFVVIAIRISTIPEDGSLVRGDMVSHIVPIYEWRDGLLGYPGVTYPRGFHALFLTLSFGLNPALVSNSIFILLMVFGWLLFAGLVRGHLGDITSSCILLLAGGGGILGIPDGIIENTGWWLVRQSNIQPEVSAWVFVMSFIWLIDNRALFERLHTNVSLAVIAILILGASTTNPFFFLVSAPFVICWSITSSTFSYNEIYPRGKIQILLLFSPVLVLLCSTGLMGITDWRFSGSSLDIHDASHRYDLIVEEMGVYYTDGLTLNTIIVMLTPKLELTIGELTAGKLVKLLLLPAWFIIMGVLYSNFDSQRATVFSITVASLYLVWYLGIPAPDGWAVIRTQYPHRAFSMLLLVYILKELESSKGIIIFALSLFWLSLEPEVFFDSLFRYEHSSRSIIFCIAFLLFYRLQDLLPILSFDSKSVRFWTPIFIPLVILGFWSSFNLIKFPNSDFGLMFFGSAILTIAAGLYRWPLELPTLFGISLISILSGILSGHLYDLTIGNYHESSFIIISYLLAFFVYQLLRNVQLTQFLKDNAMRLMMLVLITNGIFHIIDPHYVTPLMIPGFPEDF